MPLFAFLALVAKAAFYKVAVAVATAIAFALANPITTALLIASAVALRNLTKVKGPKGIDPASYRVSEPRAQTAARWIYGRARVGGVPIHINEDRYSGGKTINVVYLLSEGEIEGIERIWVNGLEMPTAENAASLDIIEPDVARWGVLENLARADILSIANPPIHSGVFGFFIRAVVDKINQERVSRQWIINGIASIRFYVHRGEANSRLIQIMRDRGGPDWKDSHRLEGLSAVVMEASAPNNRNLWTGIPKPEFLVRGIKIAEPDGPLNEQNERTPVWTENAASIRRHWLINVRGIAPEKINETAYIVARNLCDQRVRVEEVSRGDDDEDKAVHASDVLAATFGDDAATWPSETEQDKVIRQWNSRHAGEANDELRYSINGVIEADLDDREVEDRMDFAWAGHAVEWNDQIYFYPGRTREADLTINEDDVVADPPPTWQIEPPLDSKVTSLVGSLPQSALHDWLEYSLPRISDGDDRDDFAPVDLGAIPLVVYPKTASRLMKIHVQRANGGRTGTLTLTRGHNWEHFGIYPTRRISLDLPSEGTDPADRYFVLSGEFSFGGTVTLELQQEHINTYDQPPSIPLTFEEAGGFAFTGPLGRPVPVSVEMRYRVISDDPMVVSVYFYLADDDPDGDIIDVTHLQARVRTAASLPGTLPEVEAGPWNLSAVGHGVTFFGSVSETGYDYQVRRVYQTGVGEWAPMRHVSYVQPLPTPIIPTGYGV